MISNVISSRQSADCISEIEGSTSSAISSGNNGEALLFSINKTQIKCQKTKASQLTQVDKNRAKLRELNQQRQQILNEERKKKRSTFIAKKRQIVKKQANPNQEGESLLSLMEYTAPDYQLDPSHITSYISAIDHIQTQKSEIFDACRKVKRGEVEGVDDLQRILIDSKQSDQNICIKVFEIVETGVLKPLLSLFDQTTDIPLKRKLSQIFTNLALGDMRQVKKLMNSGLVALLLREISSNLDLPTTISCISTLGNISSTNLECRNMLLMKEPQIMERILKVNLENTGNLSLQDESVFTISNMIRHQKLDASTFMNSFLPGTTILAECLADFDFKESFNYQQNVDGKMVLNRGAGQFLLNVVQSFAILSQMELKITHPQDPFMSQYAPERVDQMVNDYGLFLPLMTILQTSDDPLLLETTWELIGFLCSCQHSLKNVQNFQDIQQVNVIDLIAENLNTNTSSKSIMRHCLFTLSNVVSDKAKYVERVVQANIIKSLGQMVEQMMAAQKTLDPLLLGIKDEIIFCVGNCVLGIADTMFVHGMELLKMAVEQGAIDILCKCLDFGRAPTNTHGMKVALDGLKRYFKLFKRASRSKNVEMEGYNQYWNTLLETFETTHQGLDILERCQYHHDQQVYKMSQKILLRYFDVESDTDPLLQLLNQMEVSKRPTKQFLEIQEVQPINQEIMKDSSIQSPEE